MHWTQKLLFLEAPENTALHSAELSLRGLFPWWVAGLLFAASAAAIFFLYFQERARLSFVRRALLAVLRTALVALVLILLLRPVLQAEFRGDRPRSVDVLLDNSQSMTQQDRRVTTADQVRVAIAEGRLPPDTPATEAPSETTKDPSRAHIVRAVLANPRLQLLDRLRRQGPTRAFLFGQRLGSVEEPLSAAFKADEQQTALADCIHDLLVRGGGDPPAAIVLVTDGRDNASGRLTLDEAAQECRDRGVPLYIYGVGSSSGGILQLKEVGMPPTVFAEDRVAVPVRWRCRGFKTGTVVVTFRLGKQVVQREFPVQEGEEVRQVVSFEVEKGGDDKREFTASIELKGDPAARDQVERPLRVLDNKVKVLYVENTPRWEYKFIQPALLRDRRVEARFLLAEGDPKALQAVPPYLEKFPETFPETTPRDPDRRPFDLLILGDVPASYLGKEGLSAVQKFVREGGGLVLIAGMQHAPSDYAGSPLAELLPVEFVKRDFKPDPSNRPQPFKPLLTYEGEHSLMLSLADTPEENAKLWKEDLWKDVRGFYWHFPVTRLRPGAVTLLAHPDLKVDDEQPMPLVATHYYGKGQVVFLATDETRRWRYNTQDKLMTRFWGQVIYQTGLPRLLGNSERVQLALERSEALLGQPGAVKVRLLNAAFEPLVVDRVPARLEYLDAKDGETRSRPIELNAVPHQPGEYRAVLPHDAPGRFELKVDKGVSLESATLPFRVELPPRHELEVAGLAEDELREAARISGGQFYREEDLYRLPQDVQPRGTPFVQRQEILLWNPLTLVLFVGLITAEWVLRKFSNLS